MVIFKFALLRIFRNPITIFASFILPVTIMLISELWEHGEMGDVISGRGYYLIAMVMLFGAHPLTNGMIRERKDKTIVRVMSTPITNLKYLAQNLLASLVPLVLQIILVCILGMALRDWSLQFIFFISITYLLFAASSIAFIFAWHAFFKYKQSTVVALTSFLTLATFILIFPLELFPPAVRYSFMIFPTYWIASALETLIKDGADVHFVITLATLAIFSIGFLMYGKSRKAY